jgi:hypothetical protein
MPLYVRDSSPGAGGAAEATLGGPPCCEPAGVATPSTSATAAAAAAAMLALVRCRLGRLKLRIARIGRCCQEVSWVWGLRPRGTDKRSDEQPLESLSAAESRWAVSCGSAEQSGGVSGKTAEPCAAPAVAAAGGVQVGSPHLQPGPRGQRQGVGGGAGGVCAGWVAAAPPRGHGPRPPHVQVG